MKILMFIGSETTSFLNILFSELSKTNTVTVVSQYPIQKSKRVKNVKYKTINSKNKFIFFIKTLFLTLNLKAFDINNVSSISLNRNFLVKNNLWKLVNIIQPDIIHIQWTSHIQYFENFLKHFKILVSLRGRAINILPVVWNEYDILYKRCFPFITAFHSVSKEMASNLNLNYNISSKKIHTIYSGLNWELIKSIPNSNKSDDKLNIISVGRSHWKKNYRLAIYGIRQLINNGFDIKYTIIGPVNDEELIFLIEELELNHHVEIKNNLPHKNVLAHIKKSDLMILSSIEEGIANVVLESLALKTLVVSSNCGGMSEIIIDNKTGFIFRNNDLDDFIRVLTNALQICSEERNKIVQEGYHLVQHQNNQKKMVEEFNQLYQKMIKQ